MKLVIKQRSTGIEFRFWMPDNGGYVRLDTTGGQNPGMDGQQICRGGGSRGGAISATPETFERECRNWYRAHVRRQAAY